MVQIGVMDASPPPPQDAPPPLPASGTNATERQWAIGIHLSALVNFQISYSIYGFAAATLIGLLWWLVIGLFLVPLYAVIAVAWLIFTIIGAVKESNGETYEYPYVIKFFP